MHAYSLHVAEIATFSGQVHVRCEEARELTPAPGQAYLARSAASTQPFLRVPLFPFRRVEAGVEFLVSAGHPFTGLAPGDLLDLIGPCGRGFSLPLRVQNLLLIASTVERLYPLLSLALDRHLSVTWLFPQEISLPELPAAVEMQRGPVTADLAMWADLVALDLPNPEDCAGQVRALVPSRSEAFVQALITPFMPCGVGACHACWVETRQGRGLACVDGPVFEL